MRKSAFCPKLRLLLACFLAGGLALSFAPPPAAAFSLFGFHLWGKKKAKDSDIIGEAKYYTVEFEPLRSTGAAPLSKQAQAAAEEEAEESVKIARSASALYAGRKKAVAGSGGVLAKARGDYARLLSAFYAAGRYGPVISITINGQEAADIPYGAELPEHSKIIVRADSGPLYKFSAAEVKFAGSVPPADAQAVRKAIAAEDEKIGFARGEQARSGKIFSAEGIAVEKWRQQGYAKAANIGRQITADHGARAVEAITETAPGRQARFGALRIDNVSAKPRMDSRYVAWMTGLKENEIYSPAALAKANARLSKLEVFRTASLEEAAKIQPNGSLPLSLTLLERPLHRFGGGGSYSTLDGVGLSSYWMHRNLFGHAERLRFDAGVSNIMGNRNSSSGDPKDYTYSLGATFVRPGVITPNTDYVASLKAEREVLDNYTAKGLYFSNGFNHVFSDRLSGYLYAQAAQMQVKDDTWGKRDFTAAGLLGGLAYDSRDNKADASKGFYGELTANPYYEAKYGNFVGKVTAEGRTYFAFDKNKRFVLALRGKAGSIAGAPISELPANLLYFIGGGGSVRGYAYRSIGLYKKGGTVIGGRSMLEGSAEMRTMITEKIGVVGFVDAGVVGSKSTPDFDQNTKLGAGLGVRYKTGLGPMRFDVALPLNREKGDSRYGLYIGIGQAF